MEGLETELQCLLEGKSVDEGPIDISGRDGFVPITKKTVGYIVCAVVINDNNEVLMMQEAKPSRAGTWYLPAGRLEPNETLQEGVQREVLEETGLEFEPTSLLCVEAARGHWFRFTFVGTITGGTLKTLDDQDEESLQGKWCPLEDVRPGNPDLPLRAADIFALLDSAVHLKEAEVKPHPVLPVLNAHTKLLLRCVFTSQDESGVTVLYGKKSCPHFPQITIVPGITSIQVPIFRLFQDVFKSMKNVRPSIHGILSVEYNGKPAKEHDGMCLTILVTLTNNDGQVPEIENKEDYDWHRLSGEELAKGVADRRERCIPLIDI